VGDRFRIDGRPVLRIAAGWFVYDAICRSRIGEHTVALAVAVFVLIMIASWIYTHVFSGRSALVHTGAFIGTLMAVNVFGVIIPNQRKITASLLASEAPDPTLGAIGKQRSLHNTYLTLPVLIMMVSGHYPMITAHPEAWLIVALLLIGGGCLRYFLVRHEVGDPFARIAWTLVIVLLALVAAIWMTAPGTGAGEPAADELTDIDDGRILAITQTHCAGCHAKVPINPGFVAPPAGVVLETLDEMRRYAIQVRQQAVTSQLMPLGNTTGMSNEERRALGAWLAAQ